MSHAPETGPAHGSLRPIASLGAWAMTLIAGVVVMSLIGVIVDAATYAEFERRLENGQEMEAEWGAGAWVGGIEMLLLLGAGIVFIIWLWRARRNAELLCVARHRLPIGWVIGGWFCPVVNLWFPRMIMADVLRASDPGTRADTRDLRMRPAGALVDAWWVAWLANWALGFVNLRLSAPDPETVTTDEYTMITYGPKGGWSLIVVEFIEVGVLATAAACLAALIIRVQNRQGQPRPVANPAPEV